MVGGARDRSGTFTSVSIEAKTRTDATLERAAARKDETERRCPISQLFRQSGIALASTWIAEPLEPCGSRTNA
jgi:putative redox protein